MNDTERILWKIPDKEKERIEFLLQNTHMGECAIGKCLVGGEEKDVYSNCLGTVAYCYDLDYEPHNLCCDSLEDALSFPVEGGPGYLDAAPIFEKMLAENFERVDFPSPGDVVLLNSKKRNPKDFLNSDIKHSLIYLGNSDIEVANLFHQKGNGGKFSIAREILKDGMVAGFFFHYYRKK